MKRDNGNSRRKNTGFSKIGLAFSLGCTAVALFTEAYAIYKEKNGDLSATFPDAENEINEAVEAVRRNLEGK